jgi:hypothetical protein
MTEATLAPDSGEATVTTSNWLEQIPEDLTYEAQGEDGAPQTLKLREHPKLKEFKSPADVAKSYLEAQKLLGKRTIGRAPLKENATDEDKKAWDAEYRKVMGVPEKPEDYQIKVPEGRKILDQDKGFFDWFLKTSHELGQSPAQAQDWFDRFNAFSDDYWAGQTKAAQEAREQSRKNLAAHYGGEEQLGKAAELAKRGFQHLAVQVGLDADEAKAFAESYGEEGPFVRVFEHLGKTIGDHKIVEGSGGSGPGNEGETREQYYQKKFPNS